jgi:hypothetical protein
MADVVKLKELAGVLKDTAPTDRALFIRVMGALGVPMDSADVQGPMRHLRARVLTLCNVGAWTDAAITIVERVLAQGPVVYDFKLAGDLNDDPACWPASSLRWYPEGYSGPHWHATVDAGPTRERTILLALVSMLLRKEEANAR